MNIEDQKKMLIVKRLILSRKRMMNHYSISIYLIGLTIFTIGVILWNYFSKETFKFSDEIVLLIFFSLTSVIFTWSQYRKLKFSSIINQNAKEENIANVKAAIKALNWKITFRKNYFIEVINTNKSDLRTWGNEMISILITDNEILINSICNVDSGTSQAFMTFGKNKENVKRLINEIEKKASPNRV